MTPLEAGILTQGLYPHYIGNHRTEHQTPDACPKFSARVCSPTSKPTRAGVAELADAWDLKSHGWKRPYEFEPRLRHHRSSCVSIRCRDWQERPSMRRSRQKSETVVGL